MGTFDSSITNPRELTPSASPTRADLPDLSRLSAAENMSAMKLSSSPLLHELEIGAIPVGTGMAAGGIIGGAYGLAAEGLVQAYKVPLAIGLGAFGASNMAADLLKTESRYMATAGQFGARGVLIGAGLGAAAFAAYEIKNYFEK
ncbi:MAG: hypothetical protein JST89_25820 [Cyanobacteria bacterium SZAS-4]|nr:hypothetical protein [Cyanobacteria bacterium SZAS-4]